MDSSRGKTILLVEDEAVIAMAETIAIKSFGYEVFRVDTGEKAVEIAAGAGLIDLVIMDIDLGKGIDGSEAARLILESRAVPIVFLTSHSEREMVEKVRGIARYGYVVKNSGDFVLRSSIEMAFELFDAHRKTKESEERYSLINNSSEDIIYSYDRAGRFTSANRAFCEAMGLGPGDILGRNHAELGFPEAQCREWEGLHREVYESGRTVSRVTSTNMPGDGLQHFEVILNPLHGPDGAISGIGGTSRNITERRRAEDALRNEVARFQHLFQNLPAAIIVIDGEDRIIECNREFGGVFGFSDDEARGRLVNDLIVPEHLKEEGSALTGKLERGIRIEVETRRKRKDGSLVDVAITATPVVIDGRKISFVIYQDLSKRVRAEEELKRKNEDLRMISDFSLGLASLPFQENLQRHILKRLMEHTNAEFSAFSDYDPEKETLVVNCFESRKNLVDLAIKLGGKRIFETESPVSAEMRGLMLRTIAGTSSTLSGVTFGAIPEKVDKAIRAATGLSQFCGIAFVDSATSTLFGSAMLAFKGGAAVPSREFLESLAHLSTVSLRRRQAEEKTRTLLKEKEILIQEVHHRIKNNMNTMSSLLFLQSTMLEDGPARNALRDAETRLKSMGVLYDKLYRSENVQGMSLKAYLQPLLEEIAAVFPNRSIVRIVTRIDDIMLDSRLLANLGIIVNELLTNALKHAFGPTAGGTIEVSSSRAGNRVTLCMADDGVGMPESLDSFDSGGFGLKLIDMLAKQIDGKMRVERGKGSTFILEFDVPSRPPPESGKA